MRINNDLFIDKVKELYMDNPCYLSSIAFWKTERILKKAETFEVKSKDNIYLYAIDHEKLVFYWSNQKMNFLFKQEETNAFDCLILHEDYYRLIKNDLINYQIDEMTPLIYRGQLTDYSLHHDFRIDHFNFMIDKDYNDACFLINSAYKGHHHKQEEIKSWTKDMAFDPCLWFWITEKKTNDRAALAISTYQAKTKETYLDWIQVSPKYHKKGLGKVLVYETIKRAFSKSNIIRVTGIADDFYKKCGFINIEKWYFIKKQKGL